MIPAPAAWHGCGPNVRGYMSRAHLPVRRACDAVACSVGPEERVEYAEIDSAEAGTRVDACRQADGEVVWQARVRPATLAWAGGFCRACRKSPAPIVNAAVDSDFLRWADGSPQVARLGGWPGPRSQLESL